MREIDQSQYATVSTSASSFGQAEASRPRSQKTGRHGLYTVKSGISHQSPVRARSQNLASLQKPRKQETFPLGAPLRGADELPIGHH